MVTKLFEYAKRYGMLPGSGIIIACVSGGADSMALLTALRELAPVCGFEVHVAHVNHQLRGGESERDFMFVRDYCFEHDIRCHYKCEDTRKYAAEQRLGIEDAARRLRYTFFEHVAHNLRATQAADCRFDIRIATAHNADDNAETALLNLARGAGSRGLSGIPPVRTANVNNVHVGMDIIRPLLCITRAEIEEFLAERNVPFIVDSTNLTDEFNRNKIRLHVTPVMKDINSAYSRHVLEAGELLRRDDEYLTSLAEEFLKKQSGGVSASELAALPEAIASRALAYMSGGTLSYEHTQQALNMCREINGSKTYKTPGGVFYRKYDTLCFSSEACEINFSPVVLSPGEDVEIPELGLRVRCREVTAETADGSFMKHSDTIHKSFNYFLFKKDEICGRIVVRPRFNGDKINILGRSVTKSLKKLFIEEKIPVKNRGSVPVLSDDNGSLAVVGICRSARALPTPGAPAIEIDFVRKDE